MRRGASRRIPLTPAERAELLRIARSAWRLLRERIPSDLDTFLPSTIPLHLVARAPGNPPSGCALFRVYRATATASPSAGQGDDVGNSGTFPIPLMRNIEVRLHRNDVLSCPHFLTELFLHEYLHFILHPALCASVALSEAVVERLVRDFALLSELPTELHALPWHFDEFAGTCGLRTDDFADIARTGPLRTVLTATSLADLRTLPSEEVWGLCSAALRRTAAVRRALAFREVLQSGVQDGSRRAADVILRSFAGRPLREGLQGFWLPFGNGRAYLVALDVGADREYRERPRWDVGAGFSRRRVQIGEGNEMTRFEVDDGKSCTDFSLRVRGEKQLDLRRVVNALERRGFRINQEEEVTLRGVFLGQNVTLRMTPPSRRN